MIVERLIVSIIGHEYDIPEYSLLNCDLVFFHIPLEDESVEILSMNICNFGSLKGLKTEHELCKQIDCQASFFHVYRQPVHHEPQNRV